MIEDPTVVSVIWWDAEDMKETWSDQKDVDEFNDKVYEVTSVGYLVRKTDKYLSLAGDRGTDASYGAVRKIPMGMVKSITEFVKAPMPDPL